LSQFALQLARSASRRSATHRGLIKGAAGGWPTAALATRLGLPLLTTLLTLLTLLALLSGLLSLLPLPAALLPLLPLLTLPAALLTLLTRLLTLLALFTRLLTLFSLLACLLTLLTLLAGLLTLLSLLACLLTLLARLLTLLSLLACLLTLLTLLAGLLTLLSLLAGLLTLLIARLHPATQGLEIVSQLTRPIQRLFQTLTLRALRRAAFRCLKVLQHIFEIVLDSLFAFASLIVPTARDQLLILPDLVRDSILTNRTGGLAKLVAGLLAVLTHASSRLVDVSFETRDLIRKRLFALADLLLLLFAVAPRLSVARQLIDISRDLFLSFQCLFGLLAKLLHALLSARSLRRIEHLSRLIHAVERAKLLCGRFSAALLGRGRL
jgi:hypothetical protein